MLLFIYIFAIFAPRFPSFSIFILINSIFSTSMEICEIWGKTKDGKIQIHKTNELIVFCSEEMLMSQNAGKVKLTSCSPTPQFLRALMVNF